MQDYLLSLNQNSTNLVRRCNEKESSVESLTRRVPKRFIFVEIHKEWHNIEVKEKKKKRKTKKIVLVNRGHSKGGQNGKSVRLVTAARKKKKKREKEKNEKALGRATAERKDNRSSTGRQNIPKDPWRITFSHAAATEGEDESQNANGGGSNDKRRSISGSPPGLSPLGTTMCDRKQTNGNDRGRQYAFTARQTVICHVFHAL